jgi:16S rRNA (guanine1207-N2)-methyltransferase
MKKDVNSHYFSKNPQSILKTYSISDSLRGHLYFFKTAAGVFSYRKIDLGTKTFIKYMEIPINRSLFLDIGCGYGPIGIVLAKENINSTTFMIDINSRAVLCARENAKLNHVENVKILNGSYFEPIKSQNLRFDAIYTNPPLKRGKREFLDFCYMVPDYLKDGGSYQFVVRRTMGAKNILEILSEKLSNMNVKVRFKRSGYWIFFLKKR